MFYACDERWWNVYADEAFKVAKDCWTCDERAAKRFGLNHVEGVEQEGLSLKPGRVHLGLNSGYQAIGLAFMWGVAKIVLLGYDFQKTGGKTHWHGNHHRDLPNLGNLDEWARRMVRLAADLRGQGVTVINASRATALRCFERRPIEEALA